MLQNREFSYKINGSAIIFNQPLTFAEQADGGYTLLGLTFFVCMVRCPTNSHLFNHEPDVYYNRATVELDLAGGYGASQLGAHKIPSDTTTVRQGDKVWGDLISVSSGSGNHLKLNYVLKTFSLAGSDITFDRNDGSPLTITFQIVFYYIYNKCCW